MRACRRCIRQDDAHRSGPATEPQFLRIDSLYTLTPYEKQLLQDHGFVVSERLKRGSFGYAFLEAYHADLPVFVSADAILHAFHMSYDALLKSVEEEVLIRNLDTLLARLHAALPELAQRYSSTGRLPKTRTSDCSRRFWIGGRSSENLSGAVAGGQSRRPRRTSR
jgi:hypothetical protein